MAYEIRERPSIAELSRRIYGWVECKNLHCETGRHRTWEGQVRCDARHGADVGRWEPQR